MAIKTNKSVCKLQQALEELEDRIIFTSNKNIQDREYGISEIRYYKKLLTTFFDYPEDLQHEIVSNLFAMVEEIELWLQE
jgi:hypothetical protein